MVVVGRTSNDELVALGVQVVTGVDVSDDGACAEMAKTVQAGGSVQSCAMLLSSAHTTLELDIQHMPRSNTCTTVHEAAFKTPCHSYSHAHMRTCARARARARRPIDIVINNAGYFYGPRESVIDGTMNFDEEVKQINICAVGLVESAKIDGSAFELCPLSRQRPTGPCVLRWVLTHALSVDDVIACQAAPSYNGTFLCRFIEGILNTMPFQLQINNLARS